VVPHILHSSCNEPFEFPWVYHVELYVGAFTHTTASVQKFLSLPGNTSSIKFSLALFQTPGNENTLFGILLYLFLALSISLSANIFASILGSS
jgi:hypothetical protein